MATLSTGISTTSMFLTPQAVDDFFAMGEDMVSVCIDVLSNDLGGNAKTLYATTTGSESDLTTAEISDLQTRDVVGCYETTELGAKVAITSNGMLSYCVTPIQGMLNALAAGEWVTDHITYTIRLSNGTLSIATLTVTILGSNDGIRIGVKDLAGGVTEDGHAPALLETDQGSIFFTDVDASDTHTVSSLANGTGYLGDFETTMPADSTGGATGEARWNFSVANADIQYLGAGDHLDQSYTVRIDDGHGSLVEEVVTVRIQGVNDGVEIGPADDLGGVTEDADASIPPDGADEDQTAEGSIAFADADLSDVHLFDVEADAGNATALGTFTLEETVDSTTIGTGRIDWRFVVANELIQHLGATEAATQTYHVSIDDQNGSSVSQDVTITIQGVNDDVIITEGADDAGFVTEDASDPDLTDGGSFAFDDVDVNDVHGVTVSGGLGLGNLDAVVTENAGAGGTVDWTFTVANADVQYLGAGETAIQTFTVAVGDGQGGLDSLQIDVTITGVNDDVELGAAKLVGGVIEDTDDPDLTDGGSIAYTDADANDTHTASYVAGGTGYLGGFVLDHSVEDVVDWSFSVANDAVQFLGAGEELVQTYDVTIDDGQGGAVTETVEVTITGVNDAVVAGIKDLTGGVTEDADLAAPVGPDAIQSDSGSIAFSDADLGDSHTVSAVASAANTSNLGTFNAVKSLDTVNGTGGLASWSFSVANADIQFLGAGETRSQSYDVTIADAATGGDATETVTVVITGVNDAVTIGAGAFAGSVTEDADSAAPGTPDTNQVASGSFAFGDLDLNDTHTASLTSSTAGFLGTFTVDPITNDSTSDGAGVVSWSFSVSNADLQSLGSSSHPTQTYTIRVDDGHGGSVTQNVVITLNGVDEPVVVISIPAVVTAADPNDHAGVGTDPVNFNGTGSETDPLSANNVMGSTVGDTISGNNGADSIIGGAGNDTLSGGNQNDTIYGDGGNDLITGGNGTDVIYGGSGNDTISAGGDSDLLIVGGWGADSLTGGAAAADTFVYLSTNDTGDTITDFDNTNGNLARRDHIDLTAIDGNGAAAGDPAVVWGGTTATANGVWYAFSGGVTTIYVDTNGSPAGAEMVIYLTGNITLTAEDFLI